MTEIHSIRKGNAEIGLSAMNLETITANNIFWPPSWTIRYQRQCDRFWKGAMISAKWTNFWPKAVHSPLISGCRKIAGSNRTQANSATENEKSHSRNKCNSSQSFWNVWLVSQSTQPFPTAQHFLSYWWRMWMFSRKVGKQVEPRGTKATLVCLPLLFLSLPVPHTVGNNVTSNVMSTSIRPAVAPLNPHLGCYTWQYFLLSA